MNGLFYLAAARTASDDCASARLSRNEQTWTCSGHPACGLNVLTLHYRGLGIRECFR